MQPTEHKQPAEKELIAQLRETLMAHEESYVPGAWERFNKEEEPKKGTIFGVGSLSGAAAILLVGLMVFLWTNHKQDKASPETAMAKPLQKLNAPVIAKAARVAPLAVNRAVDKNSSGTATKNTNVILVNNTVAATANMINKQVNPEIEPKLPVILPHYANNQTAKDQQKLSAVLPANAIAKPDVLLVKAPKVQDKMKLDDFLAAEMKKDIPVDENDILTKTTRKWALGLVVAPSFGNTKKLNMGYGLSMGYSLSEKISLNSGIAYSEMTAAKNMPPSASTVMVDKRKNLESVDEKVVGIDIPLEIKYHLNKNIYANIGVSAFAVINQNRNNTFVEGRLVQQVVNTATGAQELNTVFVSAYSTEKAPTAEIDKHKYLGFYNFSLGYKKQVFKNNSIAIEPFMKLPMKQVDKESLKLMGSGLRLKFDF